VSAPCRPIDGGVRYLCGQRAPEDLSLLPGTDWLVASWLNGGLAVIDTVSLTTTLLYPSPEVRGRADKATYADCPGPLVADEGARIGFAGTGVRRESDGTFTLYAVRFGRHQRIDVLQVDVSGRRPVASWRGCVIPPASLAANDVAALPDGGFVATNWNATAPGEVWEWQRDAGWRVLPGTETAPGPNGVLVSPDGAWVYFAGWQDRSVYRVSRGRSPQQLDRAAVGFHADNLNFAPDGTILAAGQGCFQSTCQGEASSVRVSRVHPQTLQVTPLVDAPESAAFGGSTTAVQIGAAIWVGSFRSDRIAIFPLRR
jgi:hypothetical protein